MLGTIKYIVADGNTIPIKLREKIFEAFYQINDHDKSAKSGSGIGLTLANSLVQLHKGRIYIDNNITDCTSFVVQVPLNKEAIKEGKPNSQTESNNSVDCIEVNESVYNDKATILVVEDNEELQSFLSGKFSYISKFHIIISCKLIVYIVMCFYQETN